MASQTLGSFVDGLKASNLLDSSQLEDVVGDTIGAEDPNQPQDLAERLIEESFLTRWQAEQLLGGRTAFFLGKYKLLEPLGQGGMGAVFKAEQTPIGRIVAVKVMAEHLVKNEKAVERFHREIRAATALDHPNIIRAFDADSVGDTHFLVMELVAGDDLGQITKRRGPLSVGESCEYVRQVAVGLQHAHERGLVHRDIKPSNLFLKIESAGSQSQESGMQLTTTGLKSTVKILDFGLARLTDSSAQDMSLTGTGQMMGTVNYVSPEQAKDTKSADIRSDIYSLGCTLFYLLTKRPVFQGENVMERLMARVMGEAPRVEDVRPDVPNGLGGVIAKMLRRDPAERMQTPVEVRDALVPFATLAAVIGSHESGEGADIDRLAQTVAQPTTPIRDPSVLAADTGLEQFLQNLSREADAEDEADHNTSELDATLEDQHVANDQTATEDHGAPESLEPAGDQVTTSPASTTAKTRKPEARGKLLTELAERSRSERKRLLWISATVVAFIVAATGFGAWHSAGETQLLVDWPVDDLQSAALEVDGREKHLYGEKRFSYRGRPGEYTLILTRNGFHPITQEWSFERGADITFRPEWKPTDQTVRTGEWVSLRQDFDKWLAGLETRRPAFDDKAVVNLSERLTTFAQQWPDTNETKLAFFGAKAVSQSVRQPRQINDPGNGPANG